MRVFLTGTTGYVGKRLLPVLIEQGHTVICNTRSRARLDLTASIRNKIEVFEHDFLHEVPLDKSPGEFDVAFYLLHSMGASIGGFSDLEAQTAHNFNELLNRSNAKQVIYLTGFEPSEKTSQHLESRANVLQILKEGEKPLTSLRAGIIVGSGSASFEIIRDLVEKLPFMITPSWLNTRIQPISIRNVIEYLLLVMDDSRTFNQDFDIGGPDVLTYKEMLLKYAKVRNLKRHIITLPIMTPRLSSYWLYFVTSTSYNLAVNLVDSMKTDMVCSETRIRELFDTKLLSYEDSIAVALDRIEQNMVISSWKDALVSSRSDNNLMEYVDVPKYGCLTDERKLPIAEGEEESVISKLWGIGGNNGWYYGNWLWKIRGWMDKFVGGVGLRRGRTNPNQIHPGDALDFWRVLVADKEKGRLLLYAEMKLPGEAWLEFKIKKENDSKYLIQKATFRPLGLLGRAYWYGIYPIHVMVFEGMARRIVN